MTAARLRRILDALPSLPSRDESLALDRLRWALGDALAESQRAPMPAMPPLAPVGQPLLAEVRSPVAGRDVPVATVAPSEGVKP